MELKKLMKCKECKTSCEVTSSNLVFQEEFKSIVDGNRIYLSYFICLECKKINFVQIDNGETAKLLINIRLDFAKFMRLRKKDKKIGKRAEAEYKKKRSDLTLLRKELNEKYDGTIITNKDGKEMRIELCLD